MALIARHLKGDLDPGARLELQRGVAAGTLPFERADLVFTAPLAQGEVDPREESEQRPGDVRREERYDRRQYPESEENCGCPNCPGSGGSVLEGQCCRLGLVTAK